MKKEGLDSSSVLLNQFYFFKDYSSRKRRQLYDYDNVTFYDEDEDENARESVSSNEVSLTEEEDEEEEDLLKEPIPPVNVIVPVSKTRQNQDCFCFS